MKFHDCSYLEITRLCVCVCYGEVHVNSVILWFKSAALIRFVRDYHLICAPLHAPLSQSLSGDRMTRHIVV